MVAFVGGSGLGLINTSLGLIGARGASGNAQTGRSGEQAYVNAVTGNLVLQRQDDTLESVGDDNSLVRTYNGLGQTGTEWRIGVSKTLGSLTGFTNANGSTITRTDIDGMALVYTYVSGTGYVNKDGAGAYDKMTYDNSAHRWTWTDGDTQTTELYDWSSGAGKILSSTDASGNATTYAYSGSQLSSITDASGESTKFTYNGGALTDVKSVKSDGTTTLSHVRYAYNSGKLTSVTVDLTPADDSVADGKTYVTTYAYTNSKISTITQSDGSRTTFAYNGSKVTSIVQTVGSTTRTTTISYDSANKKTTVVDPLGTSTVFTYDASNRLTNITGPAITGGTSQSTSYAYDTDSNVISQTDALGNVITYEYANGNQTLQRDSLGNTITRTFGTKNELLTQALYTGADPDGAGTGTPTGAMTTHYAYDTSDRLRFVVDAEGHVTEYRYDSQGQRIAELEFSGNSYAGTAFDESSLSSWVSATANKSLAVRTDITYDFRGQAKTVTRFAATGSDGVGLATGKSVTQYVYDAAGQLLQTVTPSGTATTGDANDGNTFYTYDGLGRPLTTTDALGNLSVNVYDDANVKTITTLANGLATTAAYDTAGELLTLTRADGGTALGTAQYWYDADGRVRMTQNALGVKQYYLYDEAGRKIAEIDGDGSMEEYAYNAIDELTATTRYATKLTATKLATLVDANGNPASVTVASLRPAGTSSDRKTWNLYDAVGRLVKSVDELGYFTETSYDGASRVIATTQYSNAYTGAITSSTTASEVVPTAGTDAANDRRTRFFYDADGHLVATLNADGDLGKNEYDSAGRLVHTVSYATRTSSTYWASGTLAQLQPQADDTRDIHTWTVYDGQDHVVGVVDGEGFLTENAYDANGNLSSQTRFGAKALIASPQITMASAMAQLRPAANANPASKDRTTVWTYTDLNQVATMTDASGTTTKYSYDNVGNLAKTEKAWNTTDARTLQAKYDKLGRVTAELSGEGSVALAALPAQATQAQIDAVWAQYGTSYTYDLAGQRTSMTDGNGFKTLFYYDSDGQLVYTINALGEIAQNVYNELEQLTQTVRYGTSLSAGTLAGMTGGLVQSAVSNAISALANSAVDSKVGLAYSLRGLLSTRTDELGNISTLTYNAFGQLKTRADRIDVTNTVTTQYDYNRRGLLSKTTGDVGGIGRVVQNNYDEFGRVSSVLDGMNLAHGWGYDRLGQVVSKTDPMAASTHATYDAFGQVLTQTDELGNVTTYSYDATERSMLVTLPEGVQLKTMFTRLSQTLTVRDGANNVTTYAYDKNGNLKATTLADGTTVENGYDHVNNLISTKDANGNNVTFGYDGANRQITRTVDPNAPGYTGLNVVTHYEYDAKGQEVKITDAAGVVTKLVYDLKGQLKERQLDPNGLNLVTKYDYDGLSNVLKVTSPANTVTQYTYDKLGRRKMEQVDPTGLNLTRSWTYDLNDNVTSATDANGNVTRYVYDLDSRLLYVVNAMGQVQQNVYDLAGRVVKTVRYLDTVSLANAPLTIDATWAQPDVDPTHDEIAYNIYNKDGRIAASGTSVGDGYYAIVKYAYDSAGRMVDRVAYAQAVLGISPDVIPAVTASPSDQRLRTVYDRLGRAIYSVDGTGGVVATKYDGNGNVIDRTAYAAVVTLDPVAAPTENSVLAALASKADASHDARIRQVYDKAGRLLWSVDGANAVTRRIYDAAGNVLQVVQYAGAITPNADPTTVTASGPSDRITTMTYDNAGRVVYSVDAMGGVTRNYYDAEGQVTERIAYKKPIAASASNTAVAIAAALELNTATDRAQRYVYDRAGRQVLSVSATGAVVETSFDGLGNALKTTSYAGTISTAGLSANPSDSDIRSLIPSTPAQNRTVQRAFDLAGRQVYSVDSLGYVSESKYDALGRTEKTVQYAQALTAGTATTATAIGQWSIGASLPALDRVHSFTYDAAGRVKSNTDGLNHAETYTYDALSSKLTYTNAKSDTWTYTYNAAGRMTRETSPQVTTYTAAADAEGDLMGQGSQATVALVTALDYDALGNLTQRTEALGLPEARTTKYFYDALGRQVRSEFPPVGVYDATENPATNGATGLAARSEQASQVLSTQTFYDPLGNAISSIDTSGNASYKVYDKAGRVAFDVDALGYVVGYTPNAFGEVTDLRRYANALTSVPVTITYAQALDLAAALSNTSDRIITTTYDQAGRASKVEEPDTTVVFVKPATEAQPEAIETKVQWRKTTNNVFNAFGDVIRTTEGSSDSLLATTDHFFDQRGLEVGILNAMGYLTTQTYTPTGELESRTESAQAVTGNWSSVPAAATPPTVVGSAEDRKTTYTYDAAGRKVSEKRWQVEVSGHSGVYAQANGTVTLPASQTADPTYQASGTARITGFVFGHGDDGSAVFSWPVPGSGTQVLVQWRVQGTQAWTSANDLIETANGTQSVSFAPHMPPGSYDIQVLYSDGTIATASQTGTLTFAAPAFNGTPGVTGSGIAGLAVAQRDTVWVIQWPKPTGDSEASFRFQRPNSSTWESATPQTDGAIQYVALPAGWAEGSYAVQLDFNHFITERTDLETTFAYDAVGNLTRSIDAQQGSTYSYYDALGRVTATVTPAASTGSTSTVTPLTQYYRNVLGDIVLTARRANGASATGESVGASADDRWEGAKYDSFGRAIQTTDAEGVSHYFSYNARGDVAKTWQAVTQNSGVSTIYQVFGYDKAGHLTSSTQPAAASLDGTSGSTKTEMLFNGFGEMTSRKVDTQEVEHWEYDKAGRVWRTNAGDGVERITVYDVLGRATMDIRNTGVAGDITVSQMTQGTAATGTAGRRTITLYDKLGRVIEQRQPTRQEAQGGLAVASVFTIAADQVTATPSYPAYSELPPNHGLLITASSLTWIHPNSVALTWGSLAALGSGDIKVELSYLTAAYQVEDQEFEDPQTEQVTHYAGAQSSGVGRTITRVLTAEEGALGAVFQWNDSSGAEGGIDHVTGLIVYKKDLYGVWQKVVEQNTPAASNGTQVVLGNCVTIDAPTDPLTQVKVYVGKAGETTLTEIAVANFGDQLRFDTANMADGTWLYDVKMKLPGSSDWVSTAKGSYSLVRPVIASIAAQITTTSAGVYSWAKPEGNLVQTLRYRLAGSNDVWRMLTVTDMPGATSGVDASALLPGSYDYELVYSNAGDPQPVAHATGQLNIIAPIGSPPIEGVQLHAYSDGRATMDWAPPPAGTTVVFHYRAQGATEWIDGLPAVTTEAGTGRQVFTMPPQSTPDVYDAELLFQRGGVTVAHSGAVVTVYAGIPQLATVLDTTPPYTPAHTDPAVGTPPVSGLAFQALVNGDWNLSWDAPAAGVTTKLEFLDPVTGEWFDNSDRITTANGRQVADATGTELAPGSYDLKLTLTDASGIIKISTGVVTIYADADIPASLINTTPAYTPEVNQPAQNYPVISATFTANNDGSWTLEWAKPPAGQVTTVNYRQQGTTPWLGANDKLTTTSTTEKLVVSPTDLAEGKWDVDVYFTSNGTRMQQALRLVTVGKTPYYAAAGLQDTTPAYTAGYTIPASGTPPIPGVAWVATPGPGGSTLSWTTPPAGTTASLRVKWHAGTVWNQVTGFQTNGSTQSRAIAPSELADDEWDLELTLVNSSGTVVGLKTGLLTVSGSGMTHSMQDTTPAYTPPQNVSAVNYPPISVIFATSATDGSWSLQWNKPSTGNTTEFKYRKVGTSPWLSFTSRIVTTSTTQKASFVAADLAPGNYEVDLYFFKNGARTGQSEGTLTVSSIAPTKATISDTTPTYVAAVYTPAVNYPVVAVQFLPASDGSWRMQWPTPAAGTTTQFRYQPPNSTQWTDTSASVVTSGANQYVDVGDVWPAGVYKLDLAILQGGARVAQATGNLTTYEDAVPPTMGETSTGYVPPVYHPDVNYPVIPVLFTANADGGWSARYPDAPAGSVAKAFFRQTGTTYWWTAEYVTTIDADGYKVSRVRPTDLAPGTYEVDIYYEANGQRTAQAQGSVITHPATPVTPDVQVNNGTYTPTSYTSSANEQPSAAISSVQSFTLTATPSGVSNPAFVLTNDGGSILQWDAPAAGVTSTFRYRVWGTANWTELPAQTANGIQSVVVPPTILPGIYEAELTLVAANGATVGHVLGRLNVPVPGSSGTVPSITPHPDPAIVLDPRQTIVQRTLDRWGNVLKQNDARSLAWVTGFTYNANNQITSQTQTDAYGNTTGSGVAVTRMLYDPMGRQIAVIDANGNANEQYWDAAGNLVSEAHADGGGVTNSYDAFGDKVASTTKVEANFNPTTNYAYDKLSRLTSVTYTDVDVRHIDSDPSHTLIDEHLQSLSESYFYDEAGRKTSQTDTGGASTSYSYDLRGNVIQTIAGGITTRMAYDAQGRKTAELDGNAHTATWAYDYFGRFTAAGHTDFGGTHHSYTYDEKTRQLTHQQGGTQDLSYTYDSAGQLTRIQEESTDTVTELSYDQAGNRIRERTLQDGVVFQDNHIAYDALGRMQWVADASAHVTIEYDKVGNRSHITTHVITEGVNGEPAGETAQDSDRYFRYDAMNRQTLADAVDAQGNLGTSGHAMSYDLVGHKTADTWMGHRVTLQAGTSYDELVYSGDTEPTLVTRTTPDSWKAQLGLTTEQYGHDALGRIASIDRDGTRVDDRFYDAAGHLVQSGAQAGSLQPGYLAALNGTNSAGAALQGNGSEIKTFSYDANGRLANQRVYDSLGTAQYDLNYTSWDGAGNLSAYTLDELTGSYASTSYSYDYQLGDSYKEGTVRAQRAGTADNLTTSSYDGNGFLTGVQDTNQPANDRHFVNDATGKVLFALQGTHAQRQLIVNGEVLGRYGEVVDDTQARAADGTGVFTTTAQFGFGFTATAGNTPQVADSTHLVTAGDTLQNIAQAVYGDSRLWYRIADANGLTGNSQLTAGQVLKVPGTELSANNAGTFRPYDPSRVVGDTTPYMPLPQPQADDGGCGGMGQIITLVVIVVVAAITEQWELLSYAQPEAIAVTGATIEGGTITLSTAATYSAADMAIAGAVGGAAGSLAGQVVGNALGIQQGFSWKQLALSAVSGGISGGLSGVDFTGGALNSVGNTIARAAVGNALTQGIAVTTGLQHSFSWQSVAASAVGAGVGSGMNRELGLLDNNGMRTNAYSGADLVARSALSGFTAGMATAAMRGGRISVQQVAIDAFGQALGNGFVDANSSPGQKPQVNADGFVPTAENWQRLVEGAAPQNNIRPQGVLYASNALGDAVLTDAGPGDSYDDEDGGTVPSRSWVDENGVVQVRPLWSSIDADSREIASGSSLPAGWNMRDASAALIQQQYAARQANAPSVTAWNGVSRDSPALAYLKNSLGGVDPVRGDQMQFQVAQMLPDAAANEIGGLAVGKVLGSVMGWAQKISPRVSYLDPSEGWSIINTSKGLRPAPDTYLSQSMIDAHASLFESGATRIQGLVPNGTIGRRETWVMPKTFADAAIAQAGGDVRRLEQLLGLQSGDLGAAPVRVDIPQPRGLRIPTGNEVGANRLWNPGGYTNGGLPEAVIEPIAPGAYTVTPIKVR
ncbi:MAG: LysM peptidoglycan-binding protein [Ramlibacter sp.]|nr:LysM peptidoglycan-binding protein [Ramlibacter sp.]